MGKHSNLGPVDPQINGLPAYGVIEELQTAYKEITGNNLRQYVWNPILSRSTPSFVQQCQWAIERSKEPVGEYLAGNMFADLGVEERGQKVDHIVTRLTDLTANKGHDKHIHYKECLDMGLKIVLLEEGDKTFQDLVLTVHHCYMKIIENHLGRRFIKCRLCNQMCLCSFPKI
jgi:hypothetical protein